MIPLPFVLESPSDNEVKLWKMLLSMRRALEGQGGPLAGWGFSSGAEGGTSTTNLGACVGFFTGQVLFVGDMGQMAVDNSSLLFMDTDNKRVGINTCAPAYPVDIYSNECDSKILALRTGNLDADIDLFPNFDTNPVGRIRVTRSSGDPSGQMIFLTNDSSGTLTERFRLPLSLTPGGVVFGGPTNTLAQDATNFFWDDTNNRLGIGTNAPSVRLDIRQGGALNGIAVERNDGQSNFAGYRVTGSATTANQFLAFFGGGGSHTGLTADRAVTSLIGFYGAETWTASAKGSYITFETTPTGSITRAERLRVGPAGQLGIGGAIFGSSGNLLRSNGAAAVISWQDHTLDFLTQYALLAGRSGGQTLNGGTAAGDDLTLSSTANVTKGNVFIGSSTGLNFDQVNTRTGIGQATPTSPLHITATSSSAAVPCVIGTDGSFTNASDNNCAWDNTITVASTASVGAARGFLNRPTFNPGAGVTITDCYASQYQAKTGSGAGAINNLYAFVGEAVYGTLKPTNAYGAVFGNVGSAGITQAVGIKIFAQSGATNNFDMEFTRNDTTAAGAYHGRIPVRYNGALKYIHVFNA